jgi:DNA-binding XRE family transcriptional regulator
VENKVKFLRKTIHWDKTQQQVADEIGVTRQVLSSVENGGLPSLLTALKIAQYFKMDITEIFFTSDVVHSEQKQKVC